MAIKLAFAVTETGPDAAAGDYFTALELGAAVQARFGWQIDYLPKGEAWYDLAGIDLLVVMVEEYELPAIRQASPHLVTVAWARNCFERWCQHTWIGNYDLHLASSRRAADFLSLRAGKLARLMRIATNPGRFNTDKRPALQTLDYVFTGHFWQAKRDIINALTALPSGYRGAIYGRHWERVPALAHLHRGFVPYDQIHKVYRQATIVIDDANHVTKDWGAANSRVFDALASGCLVITNSRSVSDDAFEGRLPVYESLRELAALLERFLSNEEERTSLLNDLRGVVLARHCYPHRALEFGLHLRLLGKRGVDFAMAPSVQKVALTAFVAEVARQRRAVPKSGRYPLVSFVVPLFNHLATTQEMLASLQSSLPDGLDYEIIFVDDASTDGTAIWLGTVQDERITTVINPSNRGFAVASNIGVRQAVGEVLALVNNDLIFEPGWIEPMLAGLLEARLSAGVVGNVQYRVADGALDHAGFFLTSDAKLCHVRSLADIQNAPHTKVLAVTGACMLLRRDDFESVGGFDEQFVNGGEDVDLCFKLRELGKEIYLARESHIRHHVSLSRGNTNIQDERNSRRLFSKWRPQIKAALASVWHDKLSSGSTVFPELLDGQLSAAFLADRELAADVLAESIMSREEAHWARLLGDIGDDPVSPELCAVEGLLPATMLGELKVAGRAVFTFTGVSRASNFYVCGRTTADCSPYPLALRLCVNEVQTTETVLDAGSLVNVGVVNPIILSGKLNRFEVEVVPMNPRAQRFDGISNDVVVSHVVLDDRIYPASGFSQRFTTR